MRDAGREVVCFGRIEVVGGDSDTRRQAGWLAVCTLVVGMLLPTIGFVYARLFDPEGVQVHMMAGRVAAPFLYTVALLCGVWDWRTLPGKIAVVVSGCLLALCGLAMMLHWW
jgi:hypothetical protein